MGVTSIIFLVLGSAFAVIFCVALLAGGKHDYMLEALDTDAFPLKEIYSAGLALQDVGLFRLRGKLGAYLREKTNLYYGHKYSEYYARIIYAQALSFGGLCLALMFLIAGAAGGLGSIFFAVMGLVMAGVFGYYFINRTAELVNKRRDECEEEFPNAISKLALLVNSGMILHSAWEMVAQSAEGTFYDLMKDSVDQMNNGKAEIDMFYDFGTLSGSDNIKKFTTALIQSVEQGGGELPGFLANQSSALWGQYRQRLLQKGEKSASALLAPIGLMFGGVVLIVLAAAMSSLSL